MDENYYSMFEKTEKEQVFDFYHSLMPVDVNKKVVERVMGGAKKSGKWVIAFVIGTKPCYYKFYGSILHAHKMGIPYLIINSEQHYDSTLTHGQSEFDVYKDISVNLHIRGDLSQKSIELLSKVGWLSTYLKKKWPEVTVVPMVLGDTILTSMVPIAWMFSRNEKVIQQEAGLRSMAPESMRQAGKMSAVDFVDSQFSGKWMLLRNEPFPEQWNTFVSAAGAEYHFAPLQLNKDHLVREGYPESNIFTVGGVVVDALDVKLKEKSDTSVFDVYPALEDGQWIRMDIHRKENITEHRFKNIIRCASLLVEKGYNVNLVEMNATKYGIDTFGLRETVTALEKKKNFLLTSVWPKFSHVVEFFKSDKCLFPFTDSGGVQEELNLLGKPCVTCRFSTDRPETVQAQSNVLVPPVDSQFMFDTLDYLCKDVSLLSGKEKLYGTGPGKKTMEKIKEIMESGRTFSWAHETLGFWKEKGNSEFL